MERDPLPELEGQGFKNRTKGRHGSDDLRKNGVGQVYPSRVAATPRKQQTCERGLPRIREVDSTGVQKTLNQSAAVNDASQRRVGGPSHTRSNARTSNTSRPMGHGTLHATIRKVRTDQRLLEAGSPDTCLLPCVRDEHREDNTFRRRAPLVRGCSVFDVEEPKRMSYGKHGRCSFLRGQHVVLEGANMTPAAAKDPKCLAETLATELCSARSGFFVMDAFAGSRILGDAVVSKGYPVIWLETGVDDRQDVLSRYFAKFCKANAAAIIAIMLLIPCRTLSVAQSRGGRALRSKEFPRGTPGFHTEAERERTKEGNGILHKSITLLTVLNNLNIPFIIENPYTSYLWYDKRIIKCLSGCRSVRFHQCSVRNTERILSL